MLLRFPTRYAVYDLETTGLDPDHDEAIEIGLILVDGGNVISEHSWIVKPSTMCIDPKIEELTGITKKLLDDEGRPASECWREFLDRMSNYTPVGHNITKFDNLFIDRALYKYVQAYRVQAFPWVDTAALYKGKLLGEIITESMAQSKPLKDVEAELTELKAKRRQIEAEIRKDFTQEIEKVERLNLDIKNDRELLSDMALSLVMKGETVEVTDEYDVKYEPAFKVSFKSAK